MLQLRIHMLQIKIIHAATKTRSNQINKYFKTLENKTKQGFPGGLVVKNLPSNARDMCSVPYLGRSHMPWNS